jgi:hypothetical protein
MHTDKELNPAKRRFHSVWHLEIRLGADSPAAAHVLNPLIAVPLLVLGHPWSSVVERKWNAS